MKQLRFSLIWLALWLGWCGLGGAVEVTEGPTVSQAGTEAVLRWTTDVECGTLVKYGINRNNYNRKAEGKVGLKHEVRLTGLTPGTTYFFTAGTAKRVLKEGTFTTTSSGAAPEGTPSKTLPDAPRPPPVPPTVKPAGKPAPAPTPLPDRASYVVPPTSKTWGDRWSLQDHFNRHGADFGASSPDDYAAKAWLFLQQAKDEGLPAKLDESDGTIRIWDGRTRSFAAYNRDFTAKTYFKPGSPDYFKRQPGKPVRLRHSPANP